MSEHNPQLVPKVHPATRAAEPEDPLELVATQVPGDPELMLRCTVEEYAREGWSAEMILQLFRDPAYPALLALGRRLGPDRLAALVAQVLARCGTFRVQVKELPDPLQRLPQCELVELELPDRSEEPDIPSRSV